MFVQCAIFYFMFLFKFGSLFTYGEYEYDHENYYDWYREENEHTMLPTTGSPTTITTRQSTPNTQLPTTVYDYNMLYPEHVDFTKEIIRDESKLVYTSSDFSTRLGILTSTPKVTTSAIRLRYDTTTSENTERTLGVNGGDRTSSLILFAILDVLVIFVFYCIASFVTRRCRGNDSFNALSRNTVTTITDRKSPVNDEQAVIEMNSETAQQNEQPATEMNSETAQQNEQTAKINVIEINDVHKDEQVAMSDEPAIKIYNEKAQKYIQNLLVQDAKTDRVIVINDETTHKNEQPAVSDEAIEMINEDTQINEL